MRRSNEYEFSSKLVDDLTRILSSVSIDDYGDSRPFLPSWRVVRLELTEEALEVAAATETSGTVTVRLLRSSYLDNSSDEADLGPAPHGMHPLAPLLADHIQETLLTLEPPEGAVVIDFSI